MAKIPEKKNDGQAKYKNFAQLVQGVGKVNEESLTETERLFLNCLAAHSVKTDPHPGNATLMIWCRVKSRQAVSAIARRLRNRHHLIEKLEDGNGRGHATLYHIRTDDPRFPFPKPAKDAMPVSSNVPPVVPTVVPPEIQPEPATKPASEKPETGIGDPPKPASSSMPTGLNPGYKNEYNRKEIVPTPRALASPEPIQLFQLTVSEAEEVLNALSSKYGHELASPLLGWIYERATCASTRKPNVCANPVKYFLKGAQNFLDQHNQLSGSILTKFADFADLHGIVYCLRKDRWMHERSHVCPCFVLPPPPTTKPGVEPQDIRDFWSKALFEYGWAKPQVDLLLLKRFNVRSILLLTKQQLDAAKLALESESPRQFEPRTA